MKPSSFLLLFLSSGDVEGSPTARPRALGALRAPLVARLRRAGTPPWGSPDPAGEYPQLTPPP